MTASPANKSCKVMLVEDDLSMQGLLRMLLEIEGYQVAIAPDRKPLEEIVQAIQEARPDIILLDVHVHHVSGYDIIRRLLEAGSLPHVRIVMSSGMDVKQECLAAGADDFLMKPYTPDELIQKIRQER